MNDLSWSAALTWSALGAALTMIAIGTRVRIRRRRKNRRIGLPAPVCDRVPDWHVHAPMFTPRQAK